jgi:hypothetical protein
MVAIKKNFYITLALAACVIFAGGILFRHSQIGVFATLILAFGGGLSLLQFLDDRERHRKKQDCDHPVDR